MSGEMDMDGEQDKHSDDAKKTGAKQPALAKLANRDAVIVKTSIVGIVGNVLLAAFKAVIGVATNSVAITLDAVNNLSDALSSIITIVSTHLAHLSPNRKHPYGYGRVEYLATFIIAVLVMFAGFESLQQSIERIVQPEMPSYDVISLVIVGVAVVVKIVLGRYFVLKGKSVESSSLIASGTDASMDSVISASTLLAALIFVFTGVSLEAWLGAVISVVIVKAGVDIIRDAISKLLGERVSSELADKVRKIVCSVGGVHGAYDLLVTDFGPERLVGSVHVEVNEDVSAGEFDAITRTIQLNWSIDFGHEWPFAKRVARMP
jgi:cation diffusion facilitator family transporter